MAILKFLEWTSLHEAARRSLCRTLAKFDTIPGNKPVAILTAWRGELLDAAGRPQPEAIKRCLNDEASRRLAAEVRRCGLALVPFVGAGQEGDDGTLAPNREARFIVQPGSKLGEEEFVDCTKGLPSNSTADLGFGQKQIRLAEEVLAVPFSGASAEWLTYRLRLRSGRSFDVNEMLAGNGRALGKDEA